MRALAIVVLLCATACAGAPRTTAADPSRRCGGAPLTITHEQQVEGTIVTDLVYAIDGTTIYRHPRNGLIEPPPTMFYGTIAPGPHVLTVHARLERGDGQTTVDGRHAFTSVAGGSRVIAVRLVGGARHVDQSQLVVDDVACAR